jgi:hypothetical protein
MINRIVLYDLFMFFLILIVAGFFSKLYLDVSRTNLVCMNVIENADRYLLYNGSNYYNTRSTVNGVYFQPDYYCVWTRGRSDKDINETDRHEDCHDFVYRQREHFCGDLK